MFKIDRIGKHYLNCEKCCQLLVDPVVIVCGYIVCKKHLDELLNSKSDSTKFKCLLCPKQHTIPEEGFVVCGRIQSQLDDEMNTFKPSEAYEDCKKEINDAQEYFNTIDSDMKTYICEYFEIIKGQVDLRREEIKTKVDIWYNEMIGSIESYKENCFRLSKEGNEKIESLKTELKKQLERFDRFDLGFADKNFEKIKKTVALLNKNLVGTYNEHKCSFFDKNMHYLKINESDIANAFGSLKVVEKPFESSFMNWTLQKQLLELCKFPIEQKWELIYKGSRDGFENSDFHAKCDGKLKTLTVIRTESGNIFGGFTKKEWNSAGKSYADPWAFIFSLINKDANPFKAVFSNNSQYAIVCDADYGPAFGSNGKVVKDICIDYSNNNVYCDFGYSYQHPDYPKGSEKAKSILAGTERFNIGEIEIYTPGPIEVLRFTYLID